MAIIKLTNASAGSIAALARSGLGPPTRGGAHFKFAQSCTTCGRLLTAPVAMLGVLVACPHCGAEFLARDAGAPGQHTMRGTLLDRADELLDRSRGACSRRAVM